MALMGGPDGTFRERVQPEDLTALMAAVAGDPRLVDRLQQLVAEWADLAEAQRVAAVGSFDFDLASGVFQASEEMDRLYGVERGRLPATMDTYLHQVPPDDWESAGNWFLGVRESGERGVCDYRIIDPDGEGGVRWVRGTAVVRRDRAGEVVALFGTIQDVTEQRRAEQDIRRLATIVDSSGEAILSTDLDGAVVSWNPAAERMFGYRAEEILGRSTLMLAADPEEGAERVKRAVAGGASTGYAMVALARGGRRFDVEVTAGPLYDASGRVVGATAIVRDVTERRRAEERFEGLLESAPEPMVIADGDGRIVMVNAATEAVFGHPREALIGQSIEVLVPARLRTAHEHHRAAYAETPECRSPGGEVVGVRADGSEFPVEVSISRLETDDGLLLATVVRDITERKAAEAALARQALHDPLTGLANRVLLNDRLEQALARGARHGTTTAVFFVDIDRFKLLNDSRGHAAGDQLLVAVAERLLRTVRSSDTVARFGGDEFVIVSDDTEADGGPAVLGERVAAVLQAPFLLDGGEVSLSASVGVALADTPTTAEAILSDADAAMYQAKEQGRARVEFFDHTMRRNAEIRLGIHSGLRRALDRHEFRLLYQPIVDVRTARIVGVEALLRWAHPERGLASPRHFITAAEDSGLIVPIGDWVLHRAADEWATWRDAHPDQTPLRLCVNLSAHQLRRPGLVETVEGVLTRHDFPPGTLCLELTESVLIGDTDVHLEPMAALRDLGVTFALDDFGTGYSSLGYLERFPVDILKIDRRFVGGLRHNRYSTAIVVSVIELAHALDLEVVAEGIETAPQLDDLRALNCDLAQGFHLARPQPAAHIHHILTTEYQNA